MLKLWLTKQVEQEQCGSGSKSNDGWSRMDSFIHSFIGWIAERYQQRCGETQRYQERCGAARIHIAFNFNTVCIRRSPRQANQSPAPPLRFYYSYLQPMFRLDCSLPIFKIIMKRKTALHARVLWRAGGIFKKKIRSKASRINGRGILFNVDCTQHSYLLLFAVRLIWKEPKDLSRAQPHPCQSRDSKQKWDDCYQHNILESWSLRQYLMLP